MKPSGIGGQAVIEGVMMKNKENYAVAVRKPNNEIEVVTNTYRSLTTKNKFFGLPVIRGVVAFIDSMIIGTKTLTYSASFFEDEEVLPDEETRKKIEEAEHEAARLAEENAKHKKGKNKGKSGKKANEKVSAQQAKAKEEKKEKNDTVFMALTVALSMVVAVALFILLPLWISNLLGAMIHNNAVLAILEGLIRLTIFMLYIFAISRMKDIQRVFMYHGAEHKSINCIEHGFDLTVDNVKIQSKEHKRCGTSFMLFVIILSSIVFIFIRFDNIILKTIMRLVLVPIIAGVSYEFIRLAGRSENKVVAVLSRPGLWLQSLTTKEPTDDMIEVAIASVNAVFDWKEFLEGARIEELPHEEVIKEADEVIAKAFEESAPSEEVASTEESMEQADSTEEATAPKAYDDFDDDDDEDDEILRALDKYFTFKSK